MSKTKQERVKILIEQTLKEVRLPTAYFIVTNRFRVMSNETGWDTVFMQNEIVKLDPENKTIKGFNPVSKTWDVKDISLNALRTPDQYKIFTQNTRKLTPAELRAKGFEDATNFDTTVRAFPRRVEEFDLDPGTKINVKVVESTNTDSKPNK